MSIISVLIVDDEKEFQLGVKEILTRSFFKKIFCAGCVEEMFLILKTESIDVVLLDNHLRGNLQGYEYIKDIKNINSNIEVIMVTADSRVELIVKSVKLGASDYLPKDSFSQDMLVTYIKRAYDTKKIKENNKALSEFVSWQEGELKKELVCTSKCIVESITKIERLVRTTITNSVLLIGESGVGKTTIAQYYYLLLRNVNRIAGTNENNFRPIFRIKCSSINVGNFKEIFYGSINKKGILEISNHAVILLEEIEDLKKDVQDLILPLFKDEFVFFDKDIKRKNKLVFISITNNDLDYLEKNQILCKDLYYQMTSIPITITPLRERKDDIVPLLRHFTEKFSIKFSKKFPPLPESIIELFMNYEWPGNISELQSVLEKLFILGFEDGEYNINELPQAILSKKLSIDNRFVNKTDSYFLWNEIVDGPQSYHEKIAMCKKVVIEASLKRNNFVIAGAARDLKKNRTALHREMKDLNIEVFHR